MPSNVSLGKCYVQVLQRMKSQKFLWQSLRMGWLCAAPLLARQWPLHRGGVRSSAPIPWTCLHGPWISMISPPGALSTLDSYLAELVARPVLVPFLSTLTLMVSTCPWTEKYLCEAAKYRSLCPIQGPELMPD